MTGYKMNSRFYLARWSLNNYYSVGLLFSITNKIEWKFCKYQHLISNIAAQIIDFVKQFTTYTLGYDLGNAENFTDRKKFHRFFSLKLAEHKWYVGFKNELGQYKDKW